MVELLLVGETLLANYTFTDRIRYGVKGSEREMEQLQRVWWVSDHKKIYDFSPYPNAIRFATQDPGREVLQDAGDSRHRGDQSALRCDRARSGADDPIRARS